MNWVQGILLIANFACAFSPLCAVSANFRQAKALIEKSPSIGTPDFMQLEQLITANPAIMIEQNDEKVTAKNPLLDQTAFTLLHYAAFNDSNDVLQLIINKGGSMPGWINMPVSDKNTTPLHVAVQTKSTDEMLGILLDAGATVLAQNADQKTPLHIAAELNDKNMVTCLLKHGGLGAIDWKDATNKSPSDVTTDATIKELLVPITLQRLQDLLNTKKIDLVTSLISIRPQVLREKSNNGTTLLHLLADNPESNVVRFIFKNQYQFPVDAQNQSGQTALSLAVTRYCALAANDPAQAARKEVLMLLLHIGPNAATTAASLQLAKSQQQRFPATSDQYARATEVVALLNGTAPTTREGAKKLVNTVKEQLANLSDYVGLAS